MPRQSDHNELIAKVAKRAEQAQLLVIIIIIIHDYAYLAIQDDYQHIMYTDQKIILNTEREGYSIIVK